MPSAEHHLVNFVLILNAHLPYLLNHGHGPHGSGWITEAAVDSYLPLIEAMRALRAEGVPAPITLVVSPVLANQLESQVFRDEMELHFEQRLLACDEARASLRETGDETLLPLVDFWSARLTRLRDLFHAIDRDLVGALKALEGERCLELVGTAATYGFLPLLSRDESVHLQLAVGRAEHERLFGRAPTGGGCWLPECAYRARGWWAPTDGAPSPRERSGLEEHLAAAGYRFFVVDAHMARAGEPLGVRAEVAELGEGDGEPDVEGEPERVADSHHRRGVATRAERSPYRAYPVATERGDGGARDVPGVVALVRDPRASAPVWDRERGYPSDGAYLEFHKVRWPGGLKLWRATGRGVVPDDKASYDPAAARECARTHAAHFARLLADISQTMGDAERDAAGSSRGVHSAAAAPSAGSAGVIVAPFDIELFGHWWFEGVDFIADVYRALAAGGKVRPATASGFLSTVEGNAPSLEGDASNAEGSPSSARTLEAIEIASGSWGANGDFGVWLNEATEWTWPRVWALEEAFWEAAPAALEVEAARPVLAQAARELLLAQASDWQFLISSVGGLTDYGVRRLTAHCHDAGRLLTALKQGLERDEWDAARHLAAELWARDHVFPDVLDSVREAAGAVRGVQRRV